MTINGRIVLLRQRLGLSQKVFGERIGKSVGYVSKVEAGKIEPSPVFLSAVADTFGVDEDWLRSGTGTLVVESIGDRFKAARRAREYTQEELALELKISRNSVGMIERGTFRPGEEIVEALCDRLWIDRNWLLTGTGHMERTELTPFYTLLRQDPGVRRHIRSFIDHLERGPHKPEKEEEEPDRWVTAYVVNDVPTARLFLEKFNIEYKEERGEVKVKGERDIDRERAHEIDRRLQKARLGHIRDHEFVWRDRDGNTLITYSPYDVENVKQTWIEKVEENFYGHGTTTFVARG